LLAARSGDTSEDRSRFEHSSASPAATALVPAAAALATAAAALLIGRRRAVAVQRACRKQLRQPWRRWQVSAASRLALRSSDGGDRGEADDSDAAASTSASSSADASVLVAGPSAEAPAPGPFDAPAPLYDASWSFEDTGDPFASDNGQTYEEDSFYMMSGSREEDYDLGEVVPSWVGTLRSGAIPEPSTGQRPMEMPITFREEEVRRTVRENRVTIICGGTGCGKSTQVPQYLLDEAVDRGIEANILVTQPRRMAAVSLARRVAAERGGQVGADVGYRIRGETVPGSCLSFVTAGYLLTWLTMDPEQFSTVTHIVLDEAHVRDADMELLMLLIRLLMRLNEGPRLILMSATLESSFFRDYFKEFSRASLAAAAALPSAVLPLPPPPPPLPEDPKQLTKPAKESTRGQGFGAAVPPKAQEEVQEEEKEKQPEGEEEQSEEGLVPLLEVGNRLFPVEVLFLDDIAEGRAPGGATFPQDLAIRAASAQRGVFGIGAGALARVDKGIEAVTLEIIPTVAEGGSTILIFIPGMGDLARLHSKLYWSLPIVGSENMGKVPPKPELLEQWSEEDLEAFKPEDFRVKPSADGTAPMPTASSSSAPSGDEILPGGKPTGYRLFGLHSQIPAEDQELVMEKPPPNICHIVIATTIAESSLTLPEVCGVIDFGVHRWMAKDLENGAGATILTSVWCAKAALKQREGRAGRTRPGWCLRMVPQRFYQNHMDEFEEPEIVRIPLATLFLKAKGISDSVRKLVEGDTDLKQRLQLNSASPAALLKLLPKCPDGQAIDAAVAELAELGVLTHESEYADITTLGRIALQSPLDPRICRLLWLGSLWGCVTEAVVIAAACSVASPLTLPSRLSSGSNEEFLKSMRESFDSREAFDGGHYSEPLMLLRLFCNWARRLNTASVSGSHATKWFHASASISEQEAVDAQKMSIFVGYIADIAMRARDMCAEDNECKTRRDLHLLVRLLRRPDLSYKEQKERIGKDRPPRIGEVFRASPEELYALIAASFSNQLCVGRHSYLSARSLTPMLDALEGLPQNGIASPDAVMLPIVGTRGVTKSLREEESCIQLVKDLCGVEPTGHVERGTWTAVTFAALPKAPAGDEEEEDDDDAEDEEKQGALTMRRHVWSADGYDTLNMGFPPSAMQRIRELSIGPKLCYMAATGSRKFYLDDIELCKPCSPYELTFHRVGQAKQGTQRCFFNESSSMSSACHVTSPEIPLGEDQFGIVAATMIASSGSVRLCETTLLMAEQLLYALATTCVTNTTLWFGLGPGAGGSPEGTRSQLTSVRFERTGSGVLLGRHLPAALVLERINKVRRSMLEALTTGKVAKREGHQVLLWEDEAAQEAFKAMVQTISMAPKREANSAGSHYRPSVVWAEPTFESEEQRRAGVGDDTVIDIAALRAIHLPDKVDVDVARKAQKRKPSITHNFECPDCGERFKTWDACKLHYNDTCHLDVSSPEEEEEAKELSRPVVHQCLECGEGFSEWGTCWAHLQECGHMEWASKEVAKALCIPPPFDGEELDISDTENKQKANIEDDQAEDDEKCTIYQGTLTHPAFGEKDVIFRRLSDTEGTLSVQGATANATIEQSGSSLSIFDGTTTLLGNLDNDGCMKGQVFQKDYDDAFGTFTFNLETSSEEEEPWDLFGKGGRMAVADLREGQVVSGKVVTINTALGLFINVGAEKDALCRANQLSKPLSEYVAGEKMEGLRIFSINIEKNAFEVSARRLVSDVKQGDEVEGIVLTISKFGIFFDAGIATDVLAPLSGLPKPADEFTPGEVVELLVVRVQGNKVTVACKTEDAKASPKEKTSQGEELAKKDEKTSKGEELSKKAAEKRAAMKSRTEELSEPKRNPAPALPMKIEERAKGSTEGQKAAPEKKAMERKNDKDTLQSGRFVTEADAGKVQELLQQTAEDSQGARGLLYLLLSRRLRKSIDKEDLCVVSKRDGGGKEAQWSVDVEIKILQKAGLESNVGWRFSSGRSWRDLKSAEHDAARQAIEALFALEVP